MASDKVKIQPIEIQEVLVKALLCRQQGLIDASTSNEIAAAAERALETLRDVLAPGALSATEAKARAQQFEMDVASLRKSEATLDGLLGL